MFGVTDNTDKTLHQPRFPQTKTRCQILELPHIVDKSYQSLPKVWNVFTEMCQKHSITQVERLPEPSTECSLAAKASLQNCHRRPVSVVYFLSVFSQFLSGNKTTDPGQQTPLPIQLFSGTSSDGIHLYVWNCGSPRNEIK